GCWRRMPQRLHTAVDDTSEHIVHRGRGAAIMHMLELDPEPARHDLAHQMHRAARSVRGVIDLARIGHRIGPKCGDVGSGKVLSYNEGERYLHDHRDRREIL